MEKKVIAITQARYGSTRLPAKVLKEVKGKSLLQMHLERIKLSKEIDELVVATTYEEGSDKIIDVANSVGVKAQKGSIDDVLERFYKVAEPLKPDYVVRLTSDCPLIDAELIDKVIKYTIKNNLDYCSNTLDPKYPDGLDVEVFKFKALKDAYEKAILKSDREHVTPYIWRNSTFKGGALYRSDNFCDIDDNFQDMRMTVDEQVDFEVINKIVEEKGTDKSWREYVEYLNSGIEVLNKYITRNEGYQKSLKSD